MDLSCKYIDYEPNEHCRCYLLGYQMRCGSKECKEAIDEQNNRDDDKIDLQN